MKGVLSLLVLLASNSQILLNVRDTRDIPGAQHTEVAEVLQTHRAKAFVSLLPDQACFGNQSMRPGSSKVSHHGCSQIVFELLY